MLPVPFLFLPSFLSFVLLGLASHSLPVEQSGCVDRAYFLCPLPFVELSPDDVVGAALTSSFSQATRLILWAVRCSVCVTCCAHGTGRRLEAGRAGGRHGLTWNVFFFVFVNPHSSIFFH